jgi:hypothetical protein
MSAPKTAGNVPQDWSDDDLICDPPYRHVTISDGLGGVLSLDLTAQGLDELARACNALLTGAVPPGACLMRVWVGGDTYLIRRVKRAPTSIGITCLGAQPQEVSLSEDAISLLIRLLERTQSLRSPSTDHASQRSDD